ncbi:hypothetical protein K9M78_02740 [Candidatus Bipolaricaulota bacterium]|nr:hypothetical protein [Candidatus Bipolaricaulota bacterium]
MSKVIHSSGATCRKSADSSPVSSRVSRKTQEIREQGFSGPAMREYDELEYGYHGSYGEVRG